MPSSKNIKTSNYLTERKKNRVFRYQIKGSIAPKAKPITIGLTSFRDIAEFFAANAASVLDPDGSKGLTVEIVENKAADYFIFPPRENGEGS